MEISGTDTAASHEGPDIRAASNPEYGKPTGPPPEYNEEEANKEVNRELDQWLESTNIAEDLDKDELATIGARCKEDFDRDKDSRSEWEVEYEQWLLLAMQCKDTKDNIAGDDSDIKYPILSEAAIQFSSRAMPNILAGKEVVKGKVVGKDEDNQKANRAARISEHMSYQLTEDMIAWEEEMDNLLLILAIVGCCFKKTYRDTQRNKNVSEMVMPGDLVVDYFAKSLEAAQRVSHVYELFPNEIVSKKREGVFLDIELGQPDGTMSGMPGKKAKDVGDPDCAHEFIEQHRWLDLDEDGYQEPYIVTFHRSSGKVVRISARWDEDGVERNEKNEVMRIEPVHYFTRFVFLPSPDGSFYCRGYGSLVGTLNISINEIFNQLVTAGQLRNAGGGFLSEGIQIGRGRDGGDVQFAMNEWKTIHTDGDDIRKGVFPMPVHEPSSQLYNLAVYLIEAAKELTSQADILSGKAPRNEPATTTLARIEQGLKVFSAIYTRVYRGLDSEYKKLYRLNRLFLDDEEYFTVLDDQKAIKRADYEETGVDIRPVSNANTVADAQKLFRAMFLKDLLGMGLNDDEIKKRLLQAHSIDDIEDLLPQDGEQKPPTEAQVEQEFNMKKLDLEAEKVAVDHRKQDTEDLLAKEKMINLRADTIKKLAEAESKELGPQLDQYKAYADQLKGLIVDQDAALQKLGAQQNGEAEQGGVPSVAAQPVNPQGPGGGGAGA